MSQGIDTSIQGPGHGLAAPDCIVVGAGIFGLWAARHALKRGERVLVLEKRKVGAGASGGFLGALMPHMPDRWNANKQRQFDGLSSLVEAVRLLEADTGTDCGYRRCGRLMPLGHERMLTHLEERMAGARSHWRGADDGEVFVMEHVPPEELARRFAAPDGRPWLDPARAPFGAQFDTLSARINPRGYLDALANFVRCHGRGEIREGAAVVDVQSDGGGVVMHLADGSRIAGGRAVIANGWEAYGLLSGMQGGAGVSSGGQAVTGRGVKGQAVLIDLAHDDDLPILYDSGSYVVPHGPGMGANPEGRANRVAVGSTSIDGWVGPGVDPEMARSGFDEADTAFLDHARALCPVLEAAPIAGRWANVRPRNTIPDPLTGKIGTEPRFGPVDGMPAVSLAIGGFKISFGVGHMEIA